MSDLIKYRLNEIELRYGIHVGRARQAWNVARHIANPRKVDSRNNEDLHLVDAHMRPQLSNKSTGADHE